MSGPQHAISLLLIGFLASSALVNAKARIGAEVPEAAPQPTGLLLPTTPSFGSLSAAATATDLSIPKPAVAATALPTTPYLPATTALPATAAPLGFPAATQPIPQPLVQPVLAAPQLPAMTPVPLPAAPRIPQPFPAANPGFIAPANPGFPPLIPGGAAVGGVAPLPAFPAAVPGDGVIGGPNNFPQLSSQPRGAAAAAAPGAGLGSLMDTSLLGSSSSSSSGASGLGMGSSIGDPYASGGGSSSSGTLGGSSATLGGGAGTIGASSGGLGETLRSRRAVASSAKSFEVSASMVAGLALVAFIV